MLLTAGDDHPLTKVFRSFCGANPPTLRKAREFLRQYPQYRTPKEETPKQG